VGQKKSKKAFLILTFLAAVMLMMSCTSQGETANGTSVEEVFDETTDASDTADQEEALKQDSVPISVNNDTVELGTLAVFIPSENMEANSGIAIAGSDEEQLQQERIAGGAVGSVVSENLEPLKGITDYTEGEYVLVYGVDAD